MKIVFQNRKLFICTKEFNVLYTLPIGLEIVVNLLTLHLYIGIDSDYITITSFQHKS